MSAETINIRIEGARGVGKTTIALAVAAFLRMYHALDVRIVGYDATSTAWLEKILQDRINDPNCSPGIIEPRRIVIRDDCRDNTRLTEMAKTAEEAKGRP